MGMVRGVLPGRGWGRLSRLGEILVLDDHRLCGVIDRRLRHFLPPFAEDRLAA